MFLPVPYSCRYGKGFTLAELLIALAILGVIATFSIPKIIIAQQSAQKLSVAKEVSAAVAGAYQALKNSQGVSANTSFGDLTPYLNYVAINTTAQLDDRVGANTMYDCSTGTWTCLQMHGGGILYYNSTTFTAAASNYAIGFFYDPDGVRTGIAGDAPGKAVLFTVSYNGKLSTLNTVAPGTVLYTGTWNPGSHPDASWFSW